MGNETTSSLLRFLLPILFVSLLLSCSEEKKQSLAIGDQAPGFTVTDLDGNEFTLSDFKGSPVIIRFFLTDCKFCRADTPVFNDYYARYGSNGLKVIYIDTLGVDRKALSAFRKELNIVFPVAKDEGGVISTSYTVKALPQTIVLDPQHKIIAAILGGVSEAELGGLLSPFLKLD